MCGDFRTRKNHIRCKLINLKEHEEVASIAKVRRASGELEENVEETAEEANTEATAETVVEEQTEE